MAHGKNILITGGSGFIGKEATAIFRKNGWNVIVVSRHMEPDNTVIKLDYAQPIKAQLHEIPPIEAIVHLAAAVDLSSTQIDQLYQSNVNLVTELAKFSQSRNAHFIFASSALVAGKGAKVIASVDQVMPDLPYAKSKWMAEEIIRNIGLTHTILRIAGVFGLQGPSHLGLNKAISRLLDKNRPYQVGAGRAKRNYIYVKDVAEIIYEAVIEKIEGTHLIAGHEVKSIADMLQCLCDTFLPGRSPEIVEGLPAEDQIILPSNAFSCTRSFDNAVHDLYIRSTSQ